MKIYNTIILLLLVIVLFDMLWFLLNYCKLGENCSICILFIPNRFTFTYSQIKKVFLVVILLQSCLQSNCIVLLHGVPDAFPQSLVLAGTGAFFSLAGVAKTCREAHSYNNIN